MTPSGPRRKLIVSSHYEAVCHGCGATLRSATNASLDDWLAQLEAAGWTDVGLTDYCPACSRARTPRPQPPAPTAPGETESA